MTKICEIEPIWLFDSLFRSFHEDGAAPGGVNMLEQVVPEGFSPPRHIHHNEGEISYMIEGEVDFLVSDQAVTVRAGEMLNAPKGVPHSFLVTSPGGARMLTITTEGEFEAMAGRPDARQSSTAAPRASRPRRQSNWRCSRPPAAPTASRWSAHR